jgi:hypothetical protein
MSKIQHTVACLSLLLILCALTINPALAASDPLVRFLGADYLSGKGLVLYFDVSPDFDPLQFENSISLEGFVYPLSCHFNVRNILVCVAPVKKSEIGQAAAVSFGGTTFDLTVPETNVPRITSGVCSGYSVGSYAYGVFDYDADLIWHSIGTNVQNCPAAVGDEIPLFSPDWGDTELHYYSLDGSDNCAPDLGDGYYFDLCW